MPGPQRAPPPPLRPRLSVGPGPNIPLRVGPSPRAAEQRSRDAERGETALLPGWSRLPSRTPDHVTDLITLLTRTDTLLSCVEHVTDTHRHATCMRLGQVHTCSTPAGRTPPGTCRAMCSACTCTRMRRATLALCCAGVHALRARVSAPGAPDTPRPPPYQGVSQCQGPRIRACTAAAL